MNIFFIPSWYPTRKNPLAGIFTYEQAMAIGICFPEIMIGICTWAQGDYFLNVRKPGHFIKSLYNLLKDHPRKIALSENVVEYRVPVPEIVSPKFSFLNKHIISAACRKNFAWFEREFGTISLIHAHVSYPAGYAAMLIAKKEKVPFVITEHMSPFPFPDFFKEGKLSPLISRPLSTANRTIAVSPSLCRRIMELGLPEPKFIPNIIDESFFSPLIRKEPKSSFTFFSLGRFVPQKGIPDLLKAIAIVSKINSNIQFRIGGDPCTAEFDKLSTSLCIADKIIWLGSLSREQARDEYRKCNAFVLTSLHETFGIVYAEAIACGKPVIATKCGGPECFVNNTNGMLVESGNVTEIANALLWMVENCEFYKPDIIRRDFLKRFSRKTVVLQIKETYSEILMENKKSLPNSKS